MGYSSLSRVQTGWTGTITAVITASDTLTLTPYTRESVASLFNRLVRDVLVRTGSAPTLTVASTGVITLANWDAGIILTFSGNCDNRTGFTAGGGIYGGSTSYTAAAAPSDDYVPAYGLRLEGAMLDAQGSVIVGDGAAGGGVVMMPARSRLVVWDDTITMPELEHEYDVWHDGRVFGRVLITKATRTPLGKQRTPSQTRVDLDVVEVMGPCDEVVQSPVPWSQMPNAAGWLLGYVRTDAPGYREYLLGGATGDLYVVASDEYRFDELLTELGAHDYSWSSAGTGRVVSGGGDESYPDRLGWLLGLTSEAGVTPAHTDAEAVVPPGGIPLIGATWNRIDTEADRRAVFDRYKRHQGYIWGGASIFSCRLDMHRYAFEAFRCGWWVGKVTLGCSDMLNTPFSSSEPRGAITGYALSPVTASWLDSTQQTARVEMFIVTE